MKRGLWIILLLTTSCLRERVQDEPRKKKTDTVVYPTLKEPPPLGFNTKTDSSVITTNTYADLNSVRIFNKLDSVNRVYFKDYYLDTHTIREEGILEDGDCAGRWKYYDKKGRLYKEIDFETGDKRLYMGRTEPFDDVFLEMRAKGDNILRVYFGSRFFERHIQWDANSSYYYSQNNSDSWFEIPPEEPEEFLLRYFVRLDRQHRYSTIEFKLDRKGRIISDDATRGFARCTGDCTFSIDYAQAMDIAKKNGLTLDDNNHDAYLSWIKPTSTAGPCAAVGNYELVVADFIRTEKQRGNKVVDYFDAVVLDPWTGEFLRKSKFENVGHVHRYSSSSSGLMEAH